MSSEDEIHPASEADEEIKGDAYIISVDIGTTSLRSHVYTNHGTIKASSSKKVRFVFIIFRSKLVVYLRTLHVCISSNKDLDCSKINKYLFLLEVILL